MKPTNFSLLHIADLHLGQDETLDQFRQLQGKIGNLCASTTIDLIIIAGDFFDNSRLTDEFVEESIDILMRFGPPVVLLPGNHDCYEGNSPYKRADSWMKCNGHLHVLNANGGQDLTLGALHIWGKPVVVHDGENRPLGDISDPMEGMWNVAVAHGHVHQGPKPSIYSSIIKPAEICKSGYHYIALGHWHFNCDVSCGDVKAQYSGSPFGPTLDGTRGTGLLVTLDPDAETIVEPVYF